MVKRKRSSKSFLHTRLGEVERYGLLALGALFLLLVGFLLEEVRVLRLEAPEVTLRTHVPSVASAREDREERGEPQDSVPPAPAGPREPTLGTPGGGEAPLTRTPVRRRDFDFFEPPVALPGRPAPRVPAAGESLVVVRSGDTLSRIAARALGDSSAWRKILALNDGIDPNRLKEGQVLRVPLPLSEAAVLEEDIQTSGDILALHTVKDNEVLAKIAERYYGRQSREDWLRIQEANRDVLKNVHSLRPGITLRIPALPESR